MNFIAIIFNLILIGSIAWFFWKKTPYRVYWVGLIFKLSCGIFLGIIYQYYYGLGDTLNFFREAIDIRQYLIEKPSAWLDFFWFDQLPTSIVIDSQPRSLFFTKWLTLIVFVTGQNYWMASLYLSLFSFLGSWKLFRSIASHFPSSESATLISLLFIPSVVFWGSGIIKESLAIAPLLYMTAILLEWHNKKQNTWIDYIMVLVSFWILWNIKYYWLAIWLGVVFPFVIINVLESKVQWIRKHSIATWAIFLIVGFIIISLSWENFNYGYFFEVIVSNYNTYISFSNEEDVIHYTNLDPTLTSILFNSPLALISGLFRPFFWEASNLLQWGIALENFVLILLFGLSIYRYKEWISNFNLFHLSVVLYICLLSIFLALSTPNFGTLSRYKLAFTPFLWILLLNGSGIFKSRVKTKSD